jgi:TolB protein
METGEVIPLITRPGDQWLLDWSPATGKVLYLSPGVSRYEYFMADSDGNNPKSIDFSSLRVFPQEARFSPDGKQIVFSAITGKGTRNLHIMDLETNEVRQLVKRPELTSQPSWSPDGKHIAYTSKRLAQDTERDLSTFDWNYFDLEYYIYIASVEDGSFRRLENVVGGVPAWSPDGKWLAFQGAKGSTSEIYITPVQGGEIIQVTNGSGSYPCWSADGKKIIFESHRNKGNVRIFTIDVSKHLEK